MFETKMKNNDLIVLVLMLFWFILLRDFVRALIDKETTGRFYFIFQKDHLFRSLVYVSINVAGFIFLSNWLFQVAIWISKRS